jgi:hypothetical protein
MRQTLTLVEMHFFIDGINFFTDRINFLAMEFKTWRYPTASRSSPTASVLLPLCVGICGGKKICVSLLSNASAVRLKGVNVNASAPRFKGSTLKFQFFILRLQLRLKNGCIGNRVTWGRFFKGKFRGKFSPNKMLGKIAIFRGKSFGKSFFQQIPRNFMRKITFRGNNVRKIGPEFKKNRPKAQLIL